METLSLLILKILPEYLSIMYVAAHMKPPLVTLTLASEPGIETVLKFVL
jgi:hypothetical protein